VRTTIAWKPPVPRPPMRKTLAPVERRRPCRAASIGTLPLVTLVLGRPYDQQGNTILLLGRRFHRPVTRSISGFASAEFPSTLVPLAPQSASMKFRVSTPADRYGWWAPSPASAPSPFPEIRKMGLRCLVRRGLLPNFS